MKTNHKNSITPVIFIVSAVLMLMAGLLPGCSTQFQETSSPTRTIVDMDDNTVTVPAHINRIVVTCYGGATHEIAALGSADKIVGQPSMKQYKTLMNMYPGFNDIPNPGSFDDVNIEEILNLKPDVVIASVTSAQGNKKIADSGIPVVAVYTGRVNDTSQNKKEFQMMGELLENSNQALNLIEYWDEQLQFVQSRVKDIPLEKRKRVYYVNTNANTLTHTDGSAWWGHTFITSAGGCNVAADLGSAQEVSMEQIVEWNPDVMVIRKSSKEATMFSVSDVTNNSQLQGVKAIINNEVYMCPVGTFWWDRPAPEAVLGIVWLAKTLYPVEFADVDLESLCRDFYKSFYKYDLSAAEFESFVSQ